MLNRHGEKVYTGDDGKPYVLDEMGNKRPPLYIEPIGESSGWSIYDTSQGHCALCGKLTCHGTCFK